MLDTPALIALLGVRRVGIGIVEFGGLGVPSQPFRDVKPNDDERRSE